MKSIKAILSGQGLPRRGEKGFTLVELLIVLAILAVLAAVVIPNVTGMFGRGAEQAFDTDQETVQMAAATFYFDVHAGYDGTDTWGDTAFTAGSHYYPTETGAASSLFLSSTATTLNDHTVYQVISSSGPDVAATDAQIQAASIWMGLLVVSPGDHTAAGGYTTRGTVSLLSGEKGPYLNEIPESAMATDSYNGAVSPGGTYAWIVADDGRVYGCYRNGADDWYAGFMGTYP